jgi:exonuclease SbcC
MKNHIKTISAQNLKGQTFIHELAPVTMFVGDNFAGKTSRIDAVFLALLGWLPGIAKKPGDIHADLSSAPRLQVAAKFGQHGVVRDWFESKGSIKYSGTGDDIDYPPVALVTSEFLSLSPNERVKFLFARAKLPDEYTPEKLQLTITANVKNIKLDANTEATEASIQQLVDLIADQDPLGSAQDYVTGLATAINERKKAAVAAVQRMEKTQQGMAAIAPDAQAEADAEAAYKAAVESYSQARQAMTRVEADGDHLVQALSDAKQLAAGALLNEAEAQVELARLSKEKEKAAKACAVFPDGKEIEDKISDASQELGRAAAAESQALKETSAAEAKLNDLVSDESPCCKTCGQSTKKIRDALLPVVKAELADAKEKYTIAREKRRELDAKLSALMEDRKAFAAKLTKYKDEQFRFRKLSEQHAELQKQLANNKAASEAALETPSLEARLVSTRSDWRAKKSEVDRLGQECEHLEQAYKELMAQRARCQQQEAARAELERCRAESDVAKEAVVLMNELQAKLVDAAVAPLIETANRACGKILPSSLVYREGDIGFERNGRFYSHRSFSGTEKALAYAALSVALAQDAPLKLVIIDELGRLSRNNKKQLLTLLCGLTEAGIIDQALLVDVEPVLSRNQQFKLIEL